MPQLSIPQALQLAAQAQAAGDLAQAESIYRQTLQHQPNTPEAIYQLGLIAHRTGRDDISVDLISRAIRAIGSPNPEVFMNLGNSLYALGRVDEAIAEYRRAIAMAPDRASFHFNLSY